MKPEQLKAGVDLNNQINDITNILQRIDDLASGGSGKTIVTAPIDGVTLNALPFSPIPIPKDFAGQLLRMLRDQYQRQLDEAQRTFDAL